MDIRKLSPADRYLLYGLLLKKKRSPREEREVLRIVRGKADLEHKIDALLRLSGNADPFGDDQEWAEPLEPRSHRQRRTVVVDRYPDLTKLLRGSPLRRFLSFQQVETTLASLSQLRPRRVRLVIVNESLTARECIHYYEMSRSIQPFIKVIFLTSQSLQPDGGQAFRDNTRLMRKPIDIEALGLYAQELLSPESSSAR